MQLCCNAQLKFYKNITCRLCWECQSCRASGCDKMLYDGILEQSRFTGHAPVNIQRKNIKDKFLFHSSSKGSSKNSGLDTNSGELERGIDSDVIIMRTGERTRVLMKNPVTLVAYCDKDNVKIRVHRRHTMEDGVWNVDVGPVERPTVGTVTIDNQKLPLIITD